MREQLYRAYSTRASEFGKPEWDNAPLIREILQLRAEEARMLGFANYAELSLVSKMAQNPAEVVSFLRDLAQRAKPFAVQDRQQLGYAHRQRGRCLPRPHAGRRRWLAGSRLICRACNRRVEWGLPCAVS